MFCVQVTIPLSSVQFNNQPSVFHLEYPDTACQNCPPSPAHSHSKRIISTTADYNMGSTQTQHFSYTKYDLQNARNSLTSFDSGDSPEEIPFAPIRLSRSYDTGLDELGDYIPQKLPSDELYDMRSGMQSVKSPLEDRQRSDVQPATKQHQSNPQLNTFRMAAKRILVKKDISDEDPDALVAEFIKQKTKEESKRQTKEEQVGDIIRATHSRTPSPTAQISHVTPNGGSSSSQSGQSY